MKDSVGVLRSIAILEGTKGCLAFMVAIGLHTLAGENVQSIAESLVRHLHLNPASHYPHILIEASSQVTSSNIRLIAAGVLLYTLIRFIEAYGLWHQKRWTEWFALVSGGIYIPFEIREMYQHVNLFTLGAFSLNVLVVSYLVWLIFKPHKEKD
ncbi:DUF2127 domain-containing protein [Flavobacterium sp. W21_SRS_FM6]|uniref:DUF2127 domain-containing protein n=1 Tax=Flavobacterium sp. W21_SRS_FM6 TaxID=3240268 RepID=UPI003F8E69C0